MARDRKPLSVMELTHIAGRGALGLAIGWGYVALVLAFDLGGLASWAAASPYGPPVLIQVVALTGVAFFCTGAHVGYDNMRGETVRRARRELALRRAEMRTWTRRT
jgi:hypothetical protein